MSHPLPDPVAAFEASARKLKEMRREFDRARGWLDSAIAEHERARCALASGQVDAADFEAMVEQLRADGVL